VEQHGCHTAAATAKAIKSVRWWAVFGPGGVALGGGQSQTVHLHALALITFTLNF